MLYKLQLNNNISHGYMNDLGTKQNIYMNSKLPIIKDFVE
jgi:hypothetical protein